MKYLVGSRRKKRRRTANITPTPKAKKNTKRQEPPEVLKGWKAIGDYLGIGAATAQRWARSGMPVNREGRYMVAHRDEIKDWLGKEAHMPAPAQIVTNDAEMSAALKQSIQAVRSNALAEKPRLWPETGPFGPHPRKFVRRLLGCIARRYSKSEQESCDNFHGLGKIT